MPYARAALRSRASARCLGLRSILDLWNSEVAFSEVTVRDGVVQLTFCLAGF
jgi:hypothetical protein